MKSDLKRRICQLIMGNASISKSRADSLVDMIFSLIECEKHASMFDSVAFQAQRAKKTEKDRLIK